MSSAVGRGMSRGLVAKGLRATLDMIHTLEKNGTVALTIDRVLGDGYRSLAGVSNHGAREEPLDSS